MSTSLLSCALSEDDISKCVICSCTVREPMLLQCLHSVCQACMPDAAASVTCAMCQCATDTSSARSNLLLESRVHRARILNNVFSCTHCTDKDKQDATAVTWCYACQTSLCVTHQKQHGTFHPNHKLMPLDEHTNLPELYRPLVQSCAEHDEVLKLACFTCQVGRCFKCAHDCYTSSHDVQLLDGSAAADRMASRVVAATEALTDLRSAEISLHTRLSLPGKVADAMKESLTELRNAKKTAMDSISRAYDRAEESLWECWEILVSKAERACSSAEFLIKRLDWTIEYCQLALNTEDIARLLPQLDSLCSCVRTLLDEVRQVKPPPDPLQLVSMNMCMPHDLDLITINWIGSATLTTDSFDSTPSDCAREVKNDYYARRSVALNELEHLIKKQKEEQEHIQRDRELVEQLLEQQKVEQANLQHERHSVEQLLEQQKVEQANLQRERHSVEQLLEQQKVEQANLQRQRQSVEQLVEKQKMEQTNLQRERQKVDQLLEKQKLQQKNIQHERFMNELLEMQNKEQKARQCERQSIEQLLEEQKAARKHLQRERQAMEQLGLELKLEQQQLAPSTPLSFDGKPRGSFKAPGKCFDVAVTPHGRLLVAALADGLKEYDATSFREITTWKPDSDKLGNSVSVRTVDALLDGRAVVGLTSNLIVLLSRDSSIGSCESDENAWRLERRVAELQGPPRDVSVWGFRLLAVVEDQFSLGTMSWRCGRPGLRLLSLSDGRELHRQQLDYDTDSVSLNDRVVIVASSTTVKMEDSDGVSRSSKMRYIVDCYSHDGERLWRHVCKGNFRIISMCQDSVGRVLYAAKQGSVIALSTDDGEALSTAVWLRTKETMTPYVIALDTATRRLLALISCDGDEPNQVAIFSTVRKQIC